MPLRFRPSAIAVCGFSILLLACGSDESPSAPEPDPGAIARGAASFLTSCATCHASRDAFDLAYFAFPDTVIVRRARKHVSLSTARDIAAYVRSLAVPGKGRFHLLFQPRGQVAVTDGDFWTRLFNVPALTWPAGLTADRIKAIDLRQVVSPVDLMVWSSEGDTTDWMPDNPLPTTILQANGGAVRGLLDAYYTQPSQQALIQLVNEFRRFVRDTTGGKSPLCYGETGSQPYADDCFDAMRWMSSLAALHFVRQGISEAIPLDVVRLWWATGEAAVSTNFVPRNRPVSARRRVATVGWLYLGFSYAPTEFREENGYLGQFLLSTGRPHLAMFSALRRMVGEGGVHVPNASEPEWDGQRFWDGALAVGRAPFELRAQAALFVLDYLVSRLEGGETYRTASQSIIDGSLQQIDRDIASLPASSDSLRAPLSARRARLGTLLSAAYR